MIIRVKQGFLPLPRTKKANQSVDLIEVQGQTATLKKGG
jgi:hypothetical protein